MFGARSSLIVKNVFMNNELAMQPAISHQQCLFSPGIYKVVDSWDKYWNEYVRFLGNNNSWFCSPAALSSLHFTPKNWQCFTENYRVLQ